MGFFKKKEAPMQEKNAFDKIIFEQLKNDEDQYLTNLAQKLIERNPIVLNFDGLDIDAANKIMAFFSGVCFTINGEVTLLLDKSYLFTYEGAYSDGSLKKFIEAL